MRPRGGLCGLVALRWGVCAVGGAWLCALGGGCAPDWGGCGVYVPSRVQVCAPSRGIVKVLLESKCGGTVFTWRFGELLQDTKGGLGHHNKMLVAKTG